jgi:cytidylate kinase
VSRSPDDLVIAIDGPSGSGKSTVARRAAEALGLRYLDTGAMYRALTWLALDQAVEITDADALARLAREADLEVTTAPAQPGVRVDGRDVTTAIRDEAVTSAVSAVSAVPGVRQAMVARQRLLVGVGGIVVEGRDIGTTVLPDAPVKIFLTAAEGARARRRGEEIAGGRADAAVVDATAAAIRRRDAADSGRAASPLMQAPDAEVIDSTDLTVDEVVARVVDLARARP